MGLWQLLLRPLAMKVVVKIYADRMEFVTHSQHIVERPAALYSTRRLLVGEFSPALDCMIAGLKKLGAVGFLKPRPAITVMPMEKSEGGLSAVERRILWEVAESAGGRMLGVQLQDQLHSNSQSDS